MTSPLAAGLLAAIGIGTVPAAALAVLVGRLRVHLDRAAVGRLVVAVSEARDPDDRMLALRRTLRGSARSRDPELIAASAAAARLAIENEGLQAEIHERLEQLRASRARIVQSADAERRRIERNLHDGAQQRLVTLSLELTLLRAAGSGSNPTVAGCMERAAAELAGALDELRELARGIHPSILSDAGLGPALESLADRSRELVTVAGAPPGRLPAPVETAVYFAVADVVANAADHGRAASISVRVEHAERRVVAEVAHGESGGADAVRQALRRTADRVGAIGGSLEVVRSARGDTRVRVAVPLPGATP